METLPDSITEYPPMRVVDDDGVSEPEARRPRRRIVEAMAGPGAQRWRPAPPVPAAEGSAKLRMAMLTWLFLYPAVTLLLTATGPLMVGQPIYIRTLLVSLVMVPTMIWFVQPRLARIAGLAPAAEPVRAEPKGALEYCF